MSDVWHDLLLWLRAAPRMLYAVELCGRRRERTLTIVLGCTLLSLNRAEVIAPTSAMINKITLSESLLEILARFSLETSLVLHRGFRASARAFGRFVATFVTMLVAQHDIVSVDLASLS
jgi:hypothetical protein